MFVEYGQIDLADRSFLRENYWYGSIGGFVSCEVDDQVVQWVVGSMLRIPSRAW